MKWKQQLLELTPYQPGKSIDDVMRQYGLEKIVKLASNENPFGCSEKVIAAIKCSAASFPIYPDGYATNLREALVNHFNLSPAQFIFGNGADNIIQIISRAFLSSETNTVMAKQTFSQYKHNAVIDGAEIKEIPLIDGEHDLNGMLEAIDEKTAVVWVCNPNNPTGTYISENRLKAFIEKVPSDTLIVVDEAYVDYVVADDYCESIKLLDQFPNLIILRTFSKIYGLASLRVGYGISHPEIIKTLEPAREPFNVNTIGQAAAKAAIEDQPYAEICKQKNREGLEQFYRFCEENGLDYYPSQANFILIDFKKDGNAVFQFLLEHGFIVRSGKALGFPTSVRVTVGSKEQNEGVIQAMVKLISEKTVI
ncbi:histidinol-phosphate transaminase [Bacillus sp. FJAT-49705]|uniref:Histidinol-phosphate aminotransferase n=1 Tax=Cytobacillus citreus TaxID=2833586 RepID=A0ABS5NTZ2_9BACI|nr:histidinol-phosphate transaminase [Cytobacillus citreus]MBS4191031.1 histidinol-phosphate transaminase [Cytobacillus citreus]